MIYIRIVEKVVANFKFSGTEPLDLVKFLCKDFWEEIFQKKVIQYYYYYFTIIKNN